MSWAGNSSTLRAPWRTRCTAAALSAPNTRKATARAWLMSGAVKLSRSMFTSGTNTACTSAVVARRMGECGNSEAVCELSPRPSSTKSKRAGLGLKKWLMTLV